MRGRNKLERFRFAVLSAPVGRAATPLSAEQFDSTPTYAK